MFSWTRILGWLVGCALVSSAVLAGYFGVKELLPVRKPNLIEQASLAMTKPKISKDTVIRLEQKFLCGHKTESIMPVPDNLLGLDLMQIAQKYLPEDGWEIKSELPQVLVLSRTEWDVCTLHRSYRHLGNVEGLLGIYEGPLGVDQTLLQKEDVKISDLPNDLQLQIKQVKEFNKLSPEAKLELRDTLEFQDDTSLNEFLDNLDEYSSGE